ESASDLGRLDMEAIGQVRKDAWPQARDADGMHEVLTGLGFVTAAEAERDPHWPALLRALVAEDRATCLQSAGQRWWVAAERLPQLLAVHPHAAQAPKLRVPDEFARVGWTAEDALVALLRSRLTALGPVTVVELAASMAVSPGRVEQALLALQTQGYAMQGRFSPSAREQ